jgi:hypothetical protein
MGHCLSACLTVAILIALFVCCCLPVAAVMLTYVQWG